VRAIGNLAALVAPPRTRRAVGPCAIVEPALERRRLVGLEVEVPDLLARCRHLGDARVGRGGLNAPAGGGGRDLHPAVRSDRAHLQAVPAVRQFGFLVNAGARAPGVLVEPALEPAVRASRLKGEGGGAARRGAGRGRRDLRAARVGTVAHETHLGMGAHRRVDSDAEQQRAARRPYELRRSREALLRRPQQCGVGRRPGRHSTSDHLVFVPDPAGPGHDHAVVRHDGGKGVEVDQARSRGDPEVVRADLPHVAVEALSVDLRRSFEHVAARAEPRRQIAAGRRVVREARRARAVRDRPGRLRSDRGTRVGDRDGHAHGSARAGGKAAHDDVADEGTKPAAPLAPRDRKLAARGVEGDGRAVQVDLRTLLRQAHRGALRPAAGRQPLDPDAAVALERGRGLTHEQVRHDPGAGAGVERHAREHGPWLERPWAAGELAHRREAPDAPG
jgi:hypothetical protein